MGRKKPGTYRKNDPNNFAIFDRLISQQIITTQKETEEDTEQLRLQTTQANVSRKAKKNTSTEQTPSQKTWKKPRYRKSVILHRTSENGKEISSARSKKNTPETSRQDTTCTEGCRLLWPCGLQRRMRAYVHTRQPCCHDTNLRRRFRTSRRRLHYAICSMHSLDDFCFDVV